MVTFTAKAAQDYDTRIPLLVPGYCMAHELATCLLLEILSEDASIVVIGAGTGTELARLAEASRSWRFTAIDPSSAMLACAQEKLEKLGALSRVAFVEGTVADNRGDLHDAAVSILVSQFVPDDGAKLAFFQQIAASLRPGAPLLLVDHEITEPSMQQAYRQWAIRGGASSTEADAMLARIAGNWHPIARERLEGLLNEAGFEPPRPFVQALGYCGSITRKRP